MSKMTNKVAKSLLNTAASVASNNMSQSTLLAGLAAKELTQLESTNGYGLCAKKRTFPTKCLVLDVPAPETTFITTGVFASTGTDAQFASLGKVTNAFFDIDMHDMVAEGSSEEARLFGIYDQWVAEGCPDQQGNKQLGAVSLQADVKRESKLKTAYIVDQVNTKKAVELVATRFNNEVLKDVFGMTASRTTFTGSGFHCHFVLNASDGWTDAGIETAKEVHSNLTDADDLPEMNANASLFHDNKDLWNIVNEKAKSIGISIDPKVKDWGTRVSRPIGEYNRKLTGWQVKVEEICVGLRHDTLLTAKHVEEALEKQGKKQAQSVSDVAKKVAAAKGVKATDDEHKWTWGIMEDDCEIAVGVDASTYKAKHTYTAKELYEIYAKGETVEGAQVDGDDVKINLCRMNWISNRSGNAFVVIRRPGTYSQELQMFATDLDASKDYCKSGLEAKLPGWNLKTNSKCIIRFRYRGTTEKLMGMLRRNRDGKVVVDITNMNMIFAKDPALADMLYFDIQLETVFCKDTAFTLVNSAILDVHAKFLGRQADFTKYNEFSKYHLQGLASYLNEKYGIDCDSKKLVEHLETVAVKTEVKSGLLETLKSFHYTQSDLVDNWLPRVLGTVPGTKEYTLMGEYGRVWIASLAVAASSHSVNTEALKFASFPVLLGLQGKNKSTLCSKLALQDLLPKSVSGRVYGEVADILTKSSGDRLQAMEGKFFVEIAEGGNSSRKDSDKTKSFLTQTQDEGRKAYAALTSRKKRTCYFALTMNEKQPLTDATGNRRFMIIDCDDAVVCPTGEINYKLLTDNDNANLIALWAEAVARFTKGIDIDTSKDTTQFYGETVESWLLDRSFYNVANEHNEKYYAASEYEEWLMGTYIPEKVGNGATAEDWKSKFGKSEFILNAAREAKIDVTRNTQLRSAQMKHCGLEQIQTSKGNYWKPTSMKISTINSAVEVQKTHSVTEDKSVSLVDAVVEQKSIELQKKDEEIQLLKEQLAAQATAMKNMEAMMAQFMLQMGMSPVAPVAAPAPVAPAPVVEPVVVVPKKEEPARRIRTTVKKEVVEAVVEPVVAAPKKEAVAPAPRSTMLVTDLKTGKTSRQFVDIDDDGLDFTTAAPASFKSKSYDAATTSKVLGAQVDADEDDAAE